MSELEPKDSRIITQNPGRTPIEPERTGPREGETRGDKPRTGAKGTPVSEDESSERDRWQVDDERK